MSRYAKLCLIIGSLALARRHFNVECRCTFSVSVSSGFTASRRQRVYADESVTDGMLVRVMMMMKEADISLNKEEGKPKPTASQEKE